eukprot:Skav219451  [mRNA]  locus=scaffold2583:27594:28949:+ [translate_table: standard]
MLTGPLLTGPLLALSQACPAFALLDELDEAFRQDLRFEDGVPCFVVAGMTSSGKSTFLQRLTQMPFFPTDGQMCTRVPIKIEMRRGFGEPKATVRVYSYDDKRGFVAEGAGGESLSIAAACAEVHDKMNSLLKRAGFKTNAQEVILDKELRVCVTSSALPVLNVVDLPGVKLGTRDKLAIATQELLRRYILNSGTHSIFFYIIPATLDATEWTTELLAQSDKELTQQLHNRTVGIISKCDKLEAKDATGKQILCKYLSQKDLNPADKLRHGYFALGANAEGKAREEEATFAKLFHGRPETETKRLKQQTSISSLQSKVCELYAEQAYATLVPTFVRKLVGLWIQSCFGSETEKMKVFDNIVKDLLEQYKNHLKSDLSLEQISKDILTQLHNSPSGSCKTLIEMWLEAGLAHVKLCKQLTQSRMLRVHDQSMCAANIDVPSPPDPRRTPNRG